MAYATADELRFELEPGTDLNDPSAYDDLYETLVAEASEAIDQYCHRQFNVPSVATTRYFFPSVRGDELYGLSDIASITDLAVAYDSSDDGSFTTVLTNGVDYFACEDVATGMITSIVSAAPCGFRQSSFRRPSMKVTARYGWPAVPGPVHRACIILARRYFMRKDSPSGALGFADVGAVKLSTIDPDVRALLSPYKSVSRLLA